MDNEARAAYEGLHTAINDMTRESCLNGCKLISRGQDDNDVLIKNNQ